jgi:uncharacterized membrane protein YdbT with pleckstrin-like domain
MSYVDRVLGPDETVLYSTRLHWRSHLPAILLLAMAIGCAIAGAEIGNQLPLFAGAAVLLVLAIASWIPAAIRRSSSEFVVTDRRVILKRGIFGRHTIEMNRTKVESVDVDQTLMGRIMGYGTVVVRGTGGDWSRFGTSPILCAFGPTSLRAEFPDKVPLEQSHDDDRSLYRDRPLRSP